MIADNLLQHTQREEGLTKVNELITRIKVVCRKEAFDNIKEVFSLFKGFYFFIFSFFCLSFFFDFLFELMPVSFVVIVVVCASGFLSAGVEALVVVVESSLRFSVADGLG